MDANDRYDVNALDGGIVYLPDRKQETTMVLLPHIDSICVFINIFNFNDRINRNILAGQLGEVEIYSMTLQSWKGGCDVWLKNGKLIKSIMLMEN